MPGKAGSQALGNLKDQLTGTAKQVGGDLSSGAEDETNKGGLPPEPPTPTQDPKLTPNTPTVRNAPATGAAGSSTMGRPVGAPARAGGGRGGGGGGPKFRIGPKSLEHDPMSVVPDLDIRLMNRGGMVKHGSSTRVSCKGK